MPTYLVRCAHDGDFELHAPIRQGAPKICPHCDGPLVQVLTPPNLSATVTPSKRPEAVALVEREKQWNRDMPAYKRLVQSGIQPQTIDGAAEFEKHANSPLEFKLGRIVDNKQLKEAAEISSDILNTEITA